MMMPAILLWSASFRQPWVATAFTPQPHLAAIVQRIPSLSSTSLQVLSSPQQQQSNATLSSSTSSTSTVSTTPVPKYPTLRGTTVDARTIIKTGAARQYLTAIRLAHILFASRDLADASLHRLRAADISFSDLAAQISACTETRDKGGALGWINVVPTTTVDTQKRDDNNDATATTITAKQLDDNEHLDLLFPKEAREQIVQITTKPGDVVMVESSVGFHLVQVVDVMADVRKMAFRKQRKAKKGDPNNNEIDRSPSSSSQQQPMSRQKTYQLESMGCQMNSADSERMEGQLQSLGIQPFSKETDPHGKPDVVVLNTCSIRDHAEQKVYSYIGPHAKRKRDGEDVTIVVAGCVAQQEGEALLRRAPEVDLVMGPQYANRIGDLLEDVANGNQVVATEATHIMEDSTKPRRQSTVAAWVNVIYGCNERCTFCIVPTTRGVEQSRPVESIIAEITELIDQGYKEVTLLGQNIE